MSREIKWTPTIRNLLYQLLVKNFGPYSDWKNNNYPEGKRDEYFNFIQNFADAMTKLYPNNPTSKDAVLQQIAWAVTDQGTISNSHVTVYIQNISSAYENGFLRARDFPSLLLSEREKPN